jgi:hypothetical protein
MPILHAGWFRGTAFAAIGIALLIATPQVLKADQLPIYGLIAGLGCHSAGNPSFPGFAASTFTLSDSKPVTGRVTFPNISLKVWMTARRYCSEQSPAELSLKNNDPHRRGGWRHKRCTAY